MDSSVVPDFEELKKNHLRNLKHAFDFNGDFETPIKNIVLKDYYENLSNTIDYDKKFRAEQLKFYKIKSNDKQQEQINRVIQTNYNLEYCEYCRLSYWPKNCRVYMVPKARITQRNSKIIMKYKLFDYKPKYKSFKDKLLEKIINRGIYNNYI